MTRARVPFAALLCLLVAAPTFAEGDPSAVIYRQLAQVDSARRALELAYQERDDANQTRIRELEARLATLRTQRPRPRAEITRTRIALAEADDRTTQLILGRDRRARDLAMARRDLENQLHRLESPTPPTDPYQPLVAPSDAPPPTDPYQPLVPPSDTQTPTDPYKPLVPPSDTQTPTDPYKPLSDSKTPTDPYKPFVPRSDTQAFTDPYKPLVPPSDQAGANNALRRAFGDEDVAAEGQRTIDGLRLVTREDLPELMRAEPRELSPPPRIKPVERLVAKPLTELVHPPLRHPELVGLPGASGALPEFEERSLDGPDNTLLDRALEDEAVADAIGDYQAGRAERAYDAMLPYEQRSFDDLLTQFDGHPEAQAALAEALASGNPLEDVEWLASQLAGRSPEWIRTNTTLTGNGAEGMLQQFQASCVPTVMQAMHAEFDPVYALRMRQAGPVDQVDPDDPLAFNRQLADEQAALLTTPYGGDVEGAEAFGMATPRNKPGVGRPALDDLANSQAAFTGLEYQEVLNPRFERMGADQSLPIIDASLRQGIPVPMVVGTSWGPVHAVMAYDLRDVDAANGTPATEYRVYDPWSGNSTWISEREFRDQALPIETDPGTTYTHVYRIAEPGNAGRPLNEDLAAFNDQARRTFAQRSEPVSEGSPEWETDAWDVPTSNAQEN